MAKMNLYRRQYSVLSEKINIGSMGVNDVKLPNVVKKTKCRLVIWKIALNYLISRHRHCSVYGVLVQNNPFNGMFNIA